MQIAIPTLHANGSSRDAIVEPIIDASEALLAAERALIATAPNPRDYYPQGEGAFAIAAEQHNARVRLLQKIREEIYGIAEAVDATA